MWLTDGLRSAASFSSVVGMQSARDASGVSKNAQDLYSLAFVLRYVWTIDFRFAALGKLALIASSLYCSACVRRYDHGEKERIRLAYIVAPSFALAVALQGLSFVRCMRAASYFIEACALLPQLDAPRNTWSRAFAASMIMQASYNTLTVFLWAHQALARRAYSVEVCASVVQWGVFAVYAVFCLTARSAKQPESMV